MVEGIRIIEDIRPLIDKWTQLQQQVTDLESQRESLKAHVLQVRGAILGARAQVLDHILSSRGLAVCYYDHLFREERPFSALNNNNAAEFGVFPRSRIRLLYCDWEVRQGRDMYPPDGYMAQVHEVRLLCQRDFPGPSDLHWTGRGLESFKGRQIEVRESEGTLLEVRSGEEVPPLPIRTMRQGYSRLDKYNELVYQLFEVPTLEALGFSEGSINLWRL